MLLNERRFLLPLVANNQNILDFTSKRILRDLNQDDIPVRFAITHTDKQGYHCELGILSGVNNFATCSRNTIFEFKKRDFENVEQFNAVLIIPTGIGAEIGGLSGDGGPVARLLAATCDNLITHPNVVNAADINEMTENTLYVEGSVITRLLMGTISIQKVRSNRVMLVIDKHEDNFFNDAAINSASAARAVLGLDCPIIVKMDKKVLLHSLYSSSGRAVGRIEYLEYLCEILEEYRSQYDALALSSLINVPPSFHKDYFNDDIDMVNPWGGVEAMLTHAISMLFNIPSAHSPMMTSKEILDLDVGVVDPRKSADTISTTYLHCILKGLHKSPRVINSLIHGHSGIINAADISCLVIPYGCVGLPTLAALEQGIPVIAVKENKNRMQNRLEELPFAHGKLFIVDNYLEAAGLMNAIKAGVAPETVRRPLAYTTVHDSKIHVEAEEHSNLTRIALTNNRLITEECEEKHDQAAKG